MVRWGRGDERELREGNAPIPPESSTGATTLQVVQLKNTVLHMISQHHVQYIGSMVGEHGYSKCILGKYDLCIWMIYCSFAKNSVKVDFALLIFKMQF